jgi:hypothetical protein
MTLSNSMPPSLLTIKPSLPRPSFPVLTEAVTSERPGTEVCQKKEMSTAKIEPAEVVLGEGCIIKPQISLARMTSFQVGGAAEWFIAPRHLEDLQRSLQWARAEGLAVTMLGRGSNLLISDEGLPGQASKKYSV